MAAIAKARAANTINECAREILAARGGNRKQHRNAAAVSARGYSANPVRDHGIGVRAAGHRLGRNETGVNATSYRANLIRDRETSVSASRTAGSSLGHRFFGRW